MKRTLIVMVAATILAAPLTAGKVPVKEDPGVVSSLRLLEKWVASQIEYRDQPGISMGIVHGRDLIWVKGFGVSDRAAKTPATPKTVYRIASITKLFTSTALMQLRDAGKLGLDDPVAKFIPGFKVGDPFPDDPPISIRHLLTHTSGLPGEAAFPYWTDHDFPTFEAILAALPSQKKPFATETKYRYSNLGLAIAGQVVATASGEPYETFVMKHILEPLGMTDTSVLSLPEARRARLAVGYGRRLPDGTRRILPFTDSKGLTSAANMSSTVEDLARFVAFQLGNGTAGDRRVLKESTLREMQRVHWLFPGWKRGRGLGFSVRPFDGKTLVEHAGWVGGYQTQIGFIVEDGIGVVALTNADDGVPNMYLEQALRVVGPALFKASAPELKSSLPDPAWNAYLGLYTDPSDWDVEVMLLDGRLYLYNHDYPPEESARGALVELAPAGPKTFRMTGEDASGDLVVFETGPDGRVTRVKVGENFVYPKERPAGLVKN
jgi:CubicO group peptidase (beta-lactamase class C family)